MAMIEQHHACERERDEHLREAERLDRTARVIEMVLGSFFDRIMADDELDEETDDESMDGQP